MQELQDIKRTTLMSKQVLQRENKEKDELINLLKNRNYQEKELILTENDKNVKKM